MSVRGAALWSMGAQYVVFAVQFAVSVIISRFFLSPEEVGLFSIALSAAMLVSILQDFGITRYIAGQPNLGEAQIRTCFSVSLLFALGVGLAILALAWPVSRFYGDPRLLPVLAMVAGSYLLAPFGIVPSALLQREMDFRSLFLVNVGAVLAWAAAALAFAATGWSAMSLAWATVAQQGVRAVIGMWRSGHRPRLPLSFTGSGPIMRFGGGASLLYASGSIGTRSPELIIGRLLSFEAVGLFGRASGLTGQLRTLVAGAAGGVFFPAFARLRDSGADLSGPYVRVASGLTATVWPAMAFLAAASAPLVLMLFGPVWAGVVPLLIWIALAEMIFVGLPLTMELPILLGRMRTLLALNLLDTSASITMLMLGAAYGLEWAAASRIGYGLLWFGIYARLIQGLAGFRWRSMLLVYLQSAAVSIAAVVPLLLVYTRTEPETLGFVPLSASAAAGALCWLACLFLVRHPARHEVIGFAETAWQLLPRPARSG
ncbi:MAG TPA: oligosaccharide flippase family protein [Allosphingosinicella sp.]|jgi:O-antigen/teichoic acid export membrane protein|uniref:oligosaccharide flippase family protein n=1 Tax=Allosphingosinicella sp. TaxID=2823234 RepID=UPI002F2A1826